MKRTYKIHYQLIATNISIIWKSANRSDTPLLRAGIIIHHVFEYINTLFQVDQGNKQIIKKKSNLLTIDYHLKLSIN